jgi:glycerophosphoryl diester phosphodiesterase
VNLPDALVWPPIAHRGLWRPGEAPENSLSAFDIACQHRFGVELDVRLSADGEAVVFHDERLERLAGMDAAVVDLRAEELQATPLLGGPDRIPTLAEALEVVAGRAMLLVEIKAVPDGNGVLEARVAELLDRYEGPAAVISFEAEALAWFAARRPHLPRGLDALGLEAGGEQIDVFEAACETAGPHFLVLEKASAASPAARAARAAGAPVIAWTIRSPEEAGALAADCDNFIFEGFTA